MSNTTGPSIYNPSQTQMLKDLSRKIDIKSIIILVLILLLGVGIFYVIYLNINTPIQEDPEVEITMTPTLDPNGIVIEDEEDLFYIPNIKILGNSILPSDHTSLDSYESDCQLQGFDPEINKFTKVADSAGSQEKYVIEGYEDSPEGKMMIDGLLNEGEDKIELPDPFDVTVYYFGCTDTNYVIDLKKNGVRQELYSNVDTFSFSDSGYFLYLVQNIYENGKWVLHNQIIDIVNDTKVALPQLSCMSYFDFNHWSADRLITYAKPEDEFTTRICIWESSGQLVTKINAGLEWDFALHEILLEPMGLLVNDKDVFYVYTSLPGRGCSLIMVDITDERFNKVDVSDTVGNSSHLNCGIPEIEFDMSELDLDQGVLKYRTMDDSQVESVWNEWESANVDEYEGESLL